MGDPLTMTAIALMAGTAVTAGTTAYQIGAAGDAANAAKDAAAAQTSEANRLLAEKEAKEQTAEAEGLQAQERAKLRATQRQRQAEYSGRAGTILTSPLGIPGTVSAGKKSLLGSE